MTRQCLYTNHAEPSRAPHDDNDIQNNTQLGSGTHIHSRVWDQVIKRSMHKLNAPPRWQPANAFGPTPGEFATFSSESLILAQDERWRHA